jgi:hypothetical protein
VKSHIATNCTRAIAVAVANTLWTVIGDRGNDRGVSTRIKALRTAVEKDVGCKVKHVRSTSVVETFRGKVVWDGVVETFEVTSDPEAKCCYAFFYTKADGDKRVATVREAPKINSPELAVRAFIAFCAQR